MDLDGGIALNEWISGMVGGFLLVAGSDTGWHWWLVEVNFWHGIDCLDVWNLLGWLDLVKAFDLNGGISGWLSEVEMVRGLLDWLELNFCVVHSYGLD